MKTEIIEGLKIKLAIVEEIKMNIEKYKLNPTFNNRFDIHLLKRESQKEISNDLCSNIVV